MKVSINDQEIEIFSGARLKDALMKYSVEEYHLVEAGAKVILDDMGNHYLLDGELSGGECFTLKSWEGNGTDEK